ncbi:unnamed protein product [Parnassius apollo]|uniref:(apollo) hypothetical protein n=1 Tax=Parnassius apollo TaxID=110799 RepID=A0A8S3WLF0_PARAO|nr:unnamed protein product [Parnassius apollo]
MGGVRLTAPAGVITDGPGNYSVSTACSWLISPPRLGPTPPPIRVRLESFATECGWDHLYVYDGDSVRAERLLAVFSGVIENGESGWTRQVVARSGSVLIHFFSDDAYAMEGFNVTYAAYSCPSNDHRTNCSNHGECEDGVCKCEPDWVGVACDELLCPDECNLAYGAGECTAAGCECVSGRAGPACERDSARAGWAWHWREPQDSRPAAPPALPAAHALPAPPPAAAHSLLVLGPDLLRVGGETFAPAHFLYRYKTAENKWYPMLPLDEGSPNPPSRFAHSAIMYGDEIIVYGGVVASDEPERGGGLAGLEGRAGEVTNELWKGRIQDNTVVWTNATPVTCSPHRPAPLKHCGGLNLSGHTAVLAYIGPTQKPVMLVFFGHSPHYGYMHIVQEYYIEEGAWAGAVTRGWSARAGFGHSAAWDTLSRRVYVHAGLVSESEAAQAPSSALYEYDVETKVWRPLPSAPTPRYLHTATFVSPGIMLVFGGNAHNDSAAAIVANPAASKCYSGGAFLYDVRCGQWLAAPEVRGAARAAHAAALLPHRDRPAVLIYGGFDGRLRSDALLFTAGEACGALRDADACLRAAHTHARACAWRAHDRRCLPLEEIGWSKSFDGTVKTCEVEPVFDEKRCSSAEWCDACTAAGCAWCGACYSSAQYCLRHTHQMALSLEECGAAGAEPPRDACARFHSCTACHAHRHHHAHGIDDVNQRACYWDYDTVKCKPANSSDDIRSVSTGGCSAPCATYTTCANCTAEECIWCASAGRCVDKLATGLLVVTFTECVWCVIPAGRVPRVVDGRVCGWSTGRGGCGGGVSAVGGGCSAHAGCAACRAEPACGWCDDGEGGGRGACLPGGQRRPHQPHICPQHRSVRYCRVQCGCSAAAAMRAPAAQRAVRWPRVAGAMMATAAASAPACPSASAARTSRTSARSTGRCDTTACSAGVARRLRGGGGGGGGGGCSFGAHASCAACRGAIVCGWCDDGKGSGRGACLPVGQHRPHQPHVCSQHRWHFTRCPLCQCNGHAVCDASARCIQPCSGRAVGEHCDTCAPAHWGNPLNGGVCQPCECNAQAVSCAADTGRCHCSTKGLAGDRCDKCDNTNHYHADLYNKGACYSSRGWRVATVTTPTTITWTSTIRAPATVSPPTHSRTTTTGRCHCSIKGLAGGHCDNTNHYHLDLYNKGACYCESSPTLVDNYNGSLPLQHQGVAGGHCDNTNHYHLDLYNKGACYCEFSPTLADNYNGSLPLQHQGAGGWPLRQHQPLSPGPLQQGRLLLSVLPHTRGQLQRVAATAASRGWPVATVTTPTTITWTSTTRAPATVSPHPHSRTTTTGRCHRGTKGLAGGHCGNTNHYHLHLYNKGACYHDLAVDYQFTFNLSKKEDRHLSAINFRNAPVKPDVDADFSITCSAHARMNLTVRTRSDPTERTLFSDVNCTNFRYKFAKSEHAFGVEDNVTLTTFFVYVYDFRPPLWIQISFSQYPKLNLQQFFITFSSCFLLLLLVAAALWKIKQKYDIYRRRQRLFVEMEQMASRPFSQVCVELEKGGGGGGVPAPVALEPCRGGRAAVLSLLVRLPTGGTGRAPPLGGLAVASALVTLGHHPPPPAKRRRR